MARSQDLVAAATLLGGLIGLKLFGGTIWGTLLLIMKRGLRGDDREGIAQVLVFGSAAAVESGKALVPFLALLVGVALVALVSQVGWLFTLKPLTPNLGKLNPISGMKRLFSVDSLVRLAQSLLKLVAVIAAAWIIARSIPGRVLMSGALEFPATFGGQVDVIFGLGVRLAVVLLLISLIDFFYQRYRHEKQLKMTKEEVKEEAKRMEGDPVVKRRRREVQMRLAAERLKAKVPDADVVVTNPTHYAIALKYDTESMAAPTVIAKGVDYLAQRIREIASASSIPIIEKPELARRLYADVEVGREIPERFYRAVAEILAYVYELGGRRIGPQPVPAS